MASNADVLWISLWISRPVRSLHMALAQLSTVTDKETPELLPIEAIVDLSKSASTTTSSFKAAWG